MSLPYFICALCAWGALWSLISASFCIYDKIASQKLPRHRTPEKVLFALSAVGGAAGMLFCMLLIRHKTKHKRFMIGLPLILLGHLLLIAGAIYLLYF